MSFFICEIPALEQKIRDFFRDLAEFDRNNFGGVLSALLLGSLSKGEGTWIQTPGGDRMLSDLEFFLLCPDDFSQTQTLQKELQTLRRRYFAEQDSPLFHIDATVIRRGNLARLERKILLWDAKECGHPMFGEDFRPLLPTVTERNISRADLRDVMTHRLFSLLSVGLPLRDAGEEIPYRYLLAKNSLDLMIPILTQKGLCPAGTLAQKLSRLASCGITPERLRFFEECFRLKGDPAGAPVSTQELETEFTVLVKGLLEHFAVGFSDTARHLPTRLRRRGGQGKRGLALHRFVRPGHTRRLLQSWEDKTPLTSRQRADHQVLYGYG